MPFRSGGFTGYTPRMRRLVLILALLPLAAQAQFVLQQSGTTASLRGVSDVNGKIAWASGTGGTVLRTLDGGSTWQGCAMPPGAETLDFRGIQAFDAQTAIVMSSGKGDLSRLYKTTDGCRSWKLLFTNPDAPGGFFDAMLFRDPNDGWLLGDPVKGRFYLANTQDGGATWLRSTTPSLAAADKAGGAFAASNQSLAFAPGGPVFGGGAAYLYQGPWPSCSQSVGYNDPEQCLAHMAFRRTQLALASGNGASGIFAVAVAPRALVAVGGDYTAPENAAGTAAYSRNGGATWQAATSLPHGYRSSVAYDEAARVWIAVGPNGTDLSTSDGESWKPLRPSGNDLPDTDKNWNALSLPFVVGPKGRIGRLRDDALPIPAK